MMKDALKEIIEVLERHGACVDRDSALLEVSHTGRISFSCRDLNREESLKRALDSMRIF